MVADCSVAVIGAGPYGLSIAAHLAAAAVPFRIFGTPMQTWRTTMLKDSHLKSQGFATSLYEPTGKFTLKAYCSANDIPYHDVNIPVALETFVKYGIAFQKRYVPSLEQHDIVDVSRSEGGFTLRVDNGELVTARRVVVAAGVGQFGYLPPVLAAPGPNYVTHSSAHRTVDQYAGRNVIVVGAGASAADLAFELVRSGASVRMVFRRPKIWFHDPPKPRSLRERIAAPNSGLGPGWKPRLCTDAPLLFHAMPEAFRVTVVRRFAGPAACWFTRAGIEGKVEFLHEREITHARAIDGCVHLGLTSGNGAVEEVVADHVIAATGYRVDLEKWSFLNEEIRSNIRLWDTSPALTTQFESSLSGLHFVGLAAANSFGPVSRFAFGAGFTSARLSRHLARSTKTKQFALEPIAA